MFANLSNVAQILAAIPWLSDPQLWAPGLYCGIKFLRNSGKQRLFCTEIRDNRKKCPSNPIKGWEQSITQNSMCTVYRHSSLEVWVPQLVQSCVVHVAVNLVSVWSTTCSQNINVVKWQQHKMHQQPTTGNTCNVNKQITAQGSSFTKNSEIKSNNKKLQWWKWLEERMKGTKYIPGQTRTTVSLPNKNQSLNFYGKH